MKLFPKLSKKDYIILMLISIVYFALALRNISKLPIFVDEALYLRWAQIAWHDASWRFISLTDGKQPLYIWFVIPFMKLISDPLVAGRVASVVAGFGSVIGSAYLGWLIKDKKLGYTMALLLTLSPFLFFYYRFGTMESLLTATGIWSLNLSILLARHMRLDIAMILGMVVGAGLLVKSSALFYFILMPVAYILVLNKNKIISKDTLKYLALLFISATIAQVINNVQRLSPWMHMISQKNAFFVVPYNEIFKDMPRLTNNIMDILRWHARYSSVPVIIASILGMLYMFKRDIRSALLLSTWLLAPLAGTAMIARLFAPRYISFITPYLLIFSAYFITSIKNKRYRYVALAFTIFVPLTLTYRLINDPVHFPFVSVDEGYVNGWSAGNGTKQIAQFLIEESNKSDSKVFVYTEGTFGILPQGLELYTDGKANNLEIVGLYPINKIPPQRVVDTSKTNKTFLILNNTEIDTIPDNMNEVLRFNKLKDTSMRLYIVTPQ